MSNALVRRVCYLLLIIVDLLLEIIFLAFTNAFNVLKLASLLLLKMIENNRRHKRNPNASETTSQRGLIDANWKKLLSTKLMEDEKPPRPEKNHYTGTFRRARKKQDNTVGNDLDSLQLSPNKDSHRDKKGTLTKFIAMDCEMVGVGYEGGDHMLARVSLVNKFGDCIYDKFVKAREEVKDYRTDVSGIRKEDLINGEEFAVVQQEVAQMLKGRILVGHSLRNDLGVLFLSHPKRNIRDTAKYKPFRKITKGSTPSLKRLAKELLGIDIQHGEHSSVEDAKAVMQLYCTVAKTWEQTMSEKRGYNNKL